MKILRLLLFLFLFGTGFAQTAQTGRTSQNTSQADCAAGAQAGVCNLQSGVFAAPVRPDGSGARALISHDLKTYGPSANFAGDWTITHVVDAPHIVFGTSGIDQYSLASVVKNGTGDLAGLYLYVHGGGHATQADEGTTGITVQSGEINGYFHGSITGAAGPGATALTLALGDAPHNWEATCNGCMLLDISKGAIAGMLDGKSVAFGDTYLNQFPVARILVGGKPAPLPLTRAWCATVAEIPQSARAGAGTARQVACKLGTIGSLTPAFAAGGVVSIAGRFYPEQAALSAVNRPVNGVQTLTLLARNPNPAGSLIFQGGVAGQSLSFDANLEATGFRSSYYVFGSTDGTHLIYGSQVGGNVGSNHRQYGLLPREGAEAETDHSGFHLYPSAEVVANTAQPSAPLLEPNAVDWQTGDLVENPRFQSFTSTGIVDNCIQITPSDETTSSTCFSMNVEGPGVSGTYHALRIRNGNSFKLYRQGGGVLDPVPVLKVEGTFGDLLQMPGPTWGVRGSANAVIDITDTAAGDNTPFNLFALPSNRHAGATTITYDPATKLVGFPQGFSANKLATSANCSAGTAPARCGSAASGSIVIPPGASSVVVITYAVTPDSQILITPDMSLSARLKVTCNSNPVEALLPYGISERKPESSQFTLTIAGKAGANPNCYSFTIIN